MASGNNTQDVSELIASNGQIAAQVETLSAENATLKATVLANTQEISKIKSENSTLQGSVSTLTAEKAQLTTNLTASNAEASRLTGVLNATNSSISKQALKYGCLSLTDAEGKPLAANASEAEKLAAADRIPVADKLTAIAGAVNNTLTKLGVNTATIPATGANAGAQNNLTLSQVNILTQYEAITEPNARAKFYKENASAIFAAMKAQCK
jgi:hypothetical protein